MRRITTAAATALCLAGPAIAQQDTATLCGGIGALGTWLNGAPEAADVATMESYADQLAILPQGRSQITLFSLSAPATVRLEASPQSGGDTMIELYDASGIMLRSDDDSGGGLASRIDIGLDPGTYCLKTSGLDGSAVTTDVRIGREEHPALTGGSGSGGSAGCNADTEAADLASGPVDGLLDDGVVVTTAIADTPNHRFVLSEPASVTIRAENGDADPVLRLYDAAGSMLFENDDFDGLNAQVDIADPLEPGSYCIGLEALSDASLPVTLTLRRYDPEQALLELYARGEASPPLGGPVPIADLGVLEQRTVRDVMLGGNASWFSFAVPEAGLVLIDAVALQDSDPELRLFNEMGGQLGYNDDSGDGLDSQLAVPVGAGTYVLGLSHVGGGATAPVRLSLQRFVPAR